MKSWNQVKDGYVKVYSNKHRKNIEILEIYNFFIYYEYILIKVKYVYIIINIMFIIK